MTPKLVIFDCDGVLVDTEGPVNALLAADLSAHGLAMSEEQCNSAFAGGTMLDVFDVAREKGAILSDDWVDQFYEKMFALLAKGVPVVPGVLDVIDRLEARDCTIWVASNGPMRKMRLSLGPSGLWARFQGRILSREHFAPKPAPDMLLHAIQQSGATKDEAIMIDDTPSGCLAARNAGIRCLGFAAQGNHADLTAVGAHPVRDMREVAIQLGL